MLILSMLLQITGFTQEKLAEYVGVSRASINMWLSSDESMSNKSKEMISEKFNFPVQYFNYGLNENPEIYKVIYETIQNNWKKQNKQITPEDRIREILFSLDNEYNAKVEPEQIIDENKKNIELEDEEILEGLIQGYNPYTGEVFDQDHILNVLDIRKLLINVYNKYDLIKTITTVSDLTEEERITFENLRQWRLDKAKEEGFYKPYMVFSDKELCNMIKANIKRKEDLLNVKGIGNIKYEKYADELYLYLKPASNINFTMPGFSDNFGDASVIIDDEDDLPF